MTYSQTKGGLLLGCLVVHFVCTPTIASYSLLSILLVYPTCLCISLLCIISAINGKKWSSPSAVHRQPWSILAMPAASTWYENWRVVGPSLKTGGSWVLKVQQTEAHSTEVLVLIPGIFIYTNLSISEVTTFGKSFHLIFLYIIGYNNNISWRSHNPPVPKSWGSQSPSPQNWHLQACRRL